jgi:hypothetical protein
MVSGGGGLQAITPANLASLKYWWRADQGVVYGAGMVVPLHPAGTGPAQTANPTGTLPTGLQSIEVDIDGAGTVGTATFTWKLNGVTQATGVVTASTVVLGTSGITWPFASGTYVVTDKYTSIPAVTSWTSADPSATVLSQTTLANMPGWIAPNLTLSGFTTLNWTNYPTIYYGGSAWLTATSVAPGVAFTMWMLIQQLSFPSTPICFQSAGGVYISSDSTNLYYTDGAASVFVRVPSNTMLPAYVLAYSATGNAIYFPYKTFYFTGGSTKISGTFTLGNGSAHTNGVNGAIAELILVGVNAAHDVNAQVRDYFKTTYGTA